MITPEPAGDENPEPLQWFRDNQWMFAAIGSIATVVAVFVAGYSLSKTNKQLEATTIYNIQKDGRELLGRLQGDAEVWDYLFNFKADRFYPDELKARADRALTLVLQFYSSVSNQRRDETISDSYWADIRRELCNVLSSPPVAQFWKDKVMAPRSAYDDYFKKVGQECLGWQKPAQRRYFAPTEK